MNKYDVGDCEVCLHVPKEFIEIAEKLRKVEGHENTAVAIKNAVIERLKDNGGISIHTNDEKS